MQASALKNMNARRLLNVIKEEVVDRLNKNSPNDEEITVNYCHDMLNNYLGELPFLNTYSTTVFRPTWEYYYPFMPERLLAIEASEKFGNALDVTEENRKMVNGYPYHIETHYTLWDAEGIIEILSYLPNPDKEKGEYVIENSYLLINDPYMRIVADVYIQPKEPIKYINVAIDVSGLPSEP